jgi:hypothetical protein
MLEAVTEQGAVRQSGQSVMECLMLELALELHAIGDIVWADDHRGLAMKGGHTNVDLDVEHYACLGAMSDVLEVRPPPDHRVQVGYQEIAILVRANVGKRER